MRETERASERSGQDEGETQGAVDVNTYVLVPVNAEFASSAGDTQRCMS